MKVYRSPDGRWRLEQAQHEVRVYRDRALVYDGPVSGLAAWLADQGDPVDQWVED